MKFPENLDKKRVLLNAPGVNYNVNFATYKEKGYNSTRTFEEVRAGGKGTFKSQVRSGRACFACLAGTLSRGTNRLIFKVDFKHGGVHLSAEERKRWVNLCKYHGLMPRYIGKHFLDTGNFIVKLEGLSYNKLFLYLNIARHMQEYQQVPMAAVYFRKLGLNFFLAMLLATKYTQCGTGHTVYTQGRAYAQQANKWLDASVKPREALALKKYAQTPCIKEDTIMWRLANKKSLGYFKLQSTINEVSKGLDWNPGAMKVRDLFTKEVQAKFK